MAILYDERSLDAAGWHQNRLCKLLRQVDIFRAFSASDNPSPSQERLSLRSADEAVSDLELS